MPDISMCENKKCPLRSMCYRFRAIPDEWQSFSAFEYKDGKCDFFWDLRPEYGSHVRPMEEIEQSKKVIK